MRLQNRLIKLEEEFLSIDRLVARIYHKDHFVRLSDGREMTIDEYKRLVEAGEISENRKEILVRKVKITNTIIITNGSRR